jgi:hypothetical protein
MTALARLGNNSKLQTHPPIREGAPRKDTRNSLQIILTEITPLMIFRWVPDTKSDWLRFRTLQYYFDFDLSCQSMKCRGRIEVFTAVAMKNGVF